MVVHSRENVGADPKIIHQKPLKIFLDDNGAVLVIMNHTSGS